MLAVSQPDLFLQWFNAAFLADWDEISSGEKSKGKQKGNLLIHQTPEVCLLLGRRA